MSEESPDERVARLERELASAKVEKLERELAEARHAAGSSSQPAAQDKAQLVAQAKAEFAAREDARERSRAGHRPAPIDTKLAPGPRAIPSAFLLAELLPWSWWAAFTILMMCSAPIALWMAIPKVAPAAGIASIVVLAIIHFRKTSKRFALLRWGKVVDVVHRDESSRGTYYSGTTYNNMRIPIAHGWKVTRDFYSGPKVVTRVRYQLDGMEGELMVGGRGYIDGVILAHPQNIKLALCVTAFPYDLDRDANGNWIGKLRAGIVVGMFATVIVFGGYIALIAFLASRNW